MRILTVAEREPADLIARTLRRDGTAVDVATSRATARRKIGLIRYDVVIVDPDPVDLGGAELVASLASSASGTKVIIISARGRVEDRVAGLNLGADDYLVAPVSLPELAARIAALGRRSMPAAPPVLVHRELNLDPARHTATRDGRVLELNRKEFALLHALLQAHGAVLSAAELLRRLWDDSVEPNGSVVRVTMMSLRRKLGKPDVIVTVVGSGYRLA